MRNGLILSSFQMAVWLSQHIYYSDRLSAGLIFNSFTNSLVGQRKEGAVGAGLGWYFQVKNGPALADCRASSFYFPGVDAGALCKDGMQKWVSGPLARSITNIRVMRAALSWEVWSPTSFLQREGMRRLGKDGRLSPVRQSLTRVSFICV